jgi:hypothetical protein
LTKHGHGSALKISQRVSLATQFNLVGPYASETYQIANYGIGGQYGVHIDSFSMHGGTGTLFLCLFDQKVDFSLKSFHTFSYPHFSNK